MLRDAWLIGRSDLAITLRQKETILWTFVMPLVFFYFIGTVTGGFGGGSGGRPDRLALRAPADAGFLADEIVLRLEEQGYEVVRPDEDPEAEATFEEHARRLEIPAGFTAGVLAGEPQEVVFGREDGGLSVEFDRFRLARSVYTVLADVVAASGIEAATSPGGLASLAAEDIEALRTATRALTLDVRPAGRRRTIPTGFEQTVPGTMVMFTMLILLTSGATMLLIERKQGLLRRLASAPMRRGAIVAGKWSAKLALGMIQIAFALAVGTVVFGVDWGPQLPALFLVLLAYASFMASLGMLLGNFARSEGQAVALGVLSANVFGALGGCWWPIEITPDSMQRLALFLPTGWAMDALHKLVSFGAPGSSVIPHALGMAFGALILGMVCARTFRFE